MKKFGLFLVLFFIPLLSFGQTQRTFTLNSSTQIGPTPPGYINLIGTGVNSHSFTWSTTGTVSAGACALQGGADGVTFGTTIIAAQTVTSSGAVAAATSNSNYIRVNCTTPISGSGSVVIHYSGTPPAAGGTAVTVSSGTLTAVTSITNPVTVTDGAGALNTIVDSGTITAVTTITNPVTLATATTGGWSSLNATAADGATACTNSAQAVKASGGQFGGYYINNPNTADSWLQVYNVASGSVTVGTTNPKLTFRIPGAASNSVAANVEITMGIAFDTAIAIACTSTAATNAAPSSSLEVMIYYK